MVQINAKSLGLWNKKMNEMGGDKEEFVLLNKAMQNSAAKLKKVTATAR